MSTRVRNLTLFALVVSGVFAAAGFGYYLWTRGTPALDAAEQGVRQRLAYVSQIAPESPPEYLAALAVTTYVSGHVSAAAYGYLNAVLDTPVPTGERVVTAEKALEAGAGICGQASAAALVLYDRLGIRARELHVETPAGGHVTTEVYYQGGWHWFDPTFNYFYRVPNGPPEAVLGITQVMELADPVAARVSSDARLWAQVTLQAGAAAGNGLDITGQPAVTVTADDGTVIYRRGLEATILGREDPTAVTGSAP